MRNRRLDDADIEPLLRQARALGHLIAFRRRALGMTQVMLAEKIGTSPSALSRIEHGHHRVSLATLNRIAWALKWQLVVGFFDWHIEMPFRELVGCSPHAGGYEDLKVLPGPYAGVW